MLVFGDQVSQLDTGHRGCANRFKALLVEGCAFGPEELTLN